MLPIAAVIVVVNAVMPISPSHAQVGPGYLWTDAYTRSHVSPGIVTCTKLAEQALLAEHWVNVHFFSGVSSAGAVDGGRGDMYARIICLLADPPPDHAEGFTAVIVVSGDASGVPPSGAQLSRRLRSL